MNTDIGLINIEYLRKPAGIVTEFITYLAANANRVGNRTALGFYLHDGMEQKAKEFLDQYATEPGQADALHDWIDTLPWKETGHLAMAFNW